MVITRVVVALPVAGTSTGGCEHGNNQSTGGTTFIAGKSTGGCEHGNNQSSGGTTFIAGKSTGG